MLELYRQLVPAHASVLEATVSVWLGLAVQAHNISAWGAVYQQAMVWWAAHHVETIPGTGAGSDDAAAVGPLVSQRDGDLSRSYAPPAGSVAATGADADLATTRYGQLYLRLRASRAATSPCVVR